MQQTDPISPQEFAQKIKAKYPQYAEVDDVELVDKTLQKYPQYKEQIDFKQMPLKEPEAEPVKKKEESEPIATDQESVSQSTQEVENTSSASKGSVTTELTPEEEAEFKEWYGEEPPSQDYDWRGFYKTEKVNNRLKPSLNKYYEDEEDFHAYSVGYDGRILKSPNHPTYHKTLEAEKGLGNSVKLKNGRYYSEESKEKEEEGFWTNKWRELRTGGTMLGETAASYLEGVYDIFALPQNAIAAATGIESLEASSDKFKKNTGLENPILDYYAEETKKLKEETTDYYGKKYGTDEAGNANVSPSDHISKGDYSAAFETLGGMVAESAPTSVAMMIGGASLGGASKLAGAATPAFVTGSRGDLKQADPEAYEQMTEAERSVKAFGMAGAETVFSAIGTGTIGKVYGDIIKKEGTEQGAKIFRDGLIKFYEGALKKYGAPAAATGEGIEEVATTITQNMIKGGKPFEGVADSFLAGVGGGMAHGAPMNVAQAVNHIQEKVGERGVKKRIENSGLYERSGDVFKEENTNEIDDVQISIAGNKHSRRAIEKDLNKQVKEDLITEEDAARNLQLFDQTAEFVRQTDGIELTERQQVKAVNLLKERQKLNEVTKDKNKSLFKKEHERIAEIDLQLENIREDGTGNQQTEESSGDSAGSQPTTGEGGSQETADQRNSGDVRESIGQDVTLTSLGGSKLDTPVQGILSQDGQALTVEDDSGRIYELGNVDELSESTLADLGIMVGSDPAAKTKGMGVTGEGLIEINEDGNFQYGDATLIPDRKGIKFGKKGDLRRVTLQNEDGSVTKTLRGKEAEEAAYQIMLKETQTPEQIEKVNQALEQDEQFQNELREIENSAQEETGGNIEQNTSEVTEEGVDTVQESESFRNTEQAENVNNEEDVTNVNDENSTNVNSENLRKTAQEIREKLKIKQDGNTLNSNPVGGTFAFVWNGAVETVATSLEAGATINEAVANAVAEFKKSDFYKKEKAKGDKGITLKDFKERLDKNLQPYKDAQVTPKKKAPKTQIRETTGQKDQSKKVQTTEKRLTRELYKAEAAGARKAYSTALKEQKDTKALKEILRASVVRGTFTPGKAKQLINKAMKINVKNEKEVAEFFDMYGKAATLANMKVDAKRLSDNIKKVKKRIKQDFGRFAPDARKLANLDLGNIPANLVQEYTDVMSVLADKSNKNLDWERVDNLLNDGLEEAYQNQAEERYQEKLAEVKKDGDKTKQVTLLMETLDNLQPNFSQLTEKERDIVRKFTSIPREWLAEYLSKPKLSQVIKSLNAVDGTNGTSWLDNKTLNTVVMTYEANQLAERIKQQVGDTFIKPVSNLAESFTNMFKSKKNFKTSDYQSAINGVMVQHIDTVITRIKDLSLYKELLHPITSQFNKSHEESMTTEKDLSGMFNAAKRSRVGGRFKRLIPSVKEALNARNENYNFDMQVLLQLYFRQKEYNNEANRDNAEMNLFSAKDHVQATLESNNTDYNDTSKDRIEKIFNDFSTDGQLDIDKIEKHFTPQEKALVEFMQEELSKTKQRSMEVNDHQRGETLPYPEDYFPRRSYTKGGDFVDGIDMSSNLAKMLGSQSTKASSSNRRSSTKAEALNFDTMGTFMDHVKETNIEYNVSDMIKKTGITLTQLKESENESLGMVSRATERGIKIMLDAELGHSIYTPTSKINQAYRYLVRRTFNRMLIDPIRLVLADVPSNYIPFYAANVGRLGKIKDSTKKLAKRYDGESFKDILFRDFGSTHMSRLGGNRSVDYKESEVSSLSKGRNKQFQQGIMDNLLDLMKKNKISDFSDATSEYYYKVADAPAKQIWSYRFDKEFKKRTGKDFSTSEYVSNPDYKKQYETDIRNTIKVADKAASDLFNTATKTEQKLSNQKGRGTLWTSINSFMRSFTYNENRVWWDSFESMLGRGTMERGEAIRTQMIINARGIGYSFAIQTMLTPILSALVPGMEEDEELMERAWNRALAQHGMLLLAGNRGLIFNVGASMTIEGAREMHQNKEAEEDMMGMTPKYSRDQSLLYAPSKYGSLDQFVGMGGAEGYALQTIMQAGVLGSNIGEKIYNGEEITEEDIIEWKTYQIGVGMSSQILGLPINRAGNLWQKYYEEKGKTDMLKR